MEWTKHKSCNTQYILALSFELCQLEQKTKDLHLTQYSPQKQGSQGIELGACSKKLLT